MGRRLSSDVAADIAAFGAVAIVVSLAMLTWLVGGLARGPRGLPMGPDGGSDGGLDGAHDAGISKVGSADLVPTPPTAKAAVRSVRAADRTHNVVLITIDTLRFDLGFAGYPRPVSTNIDALAARSVVYDHAYATASFTPKCLGPLHIGLYSSETHRDFQHYTNFESTNVFLAERVQAGGAHTIGAATHRYFGWKKGFDQGFDVWDTSAIPPNSTDNDPSITSDKLTDVAIAALSATVAADVPMRRGRPFVPTQPRSGPAKDHFFAWFHYLDPHLPYVPHDGAPSFATMAGAGIPRERAPYDAEVWFTDREIGRLLKHIQAQPWADDTAIILTADHGEAFGEHSHWGHGRELWEPLVHVPLMVYVPGVASRHILAKRSHIDLVPTILDLMGVDRAEGLHGTSLLEDLEGPAAAAKDRDIYIDMPEGPFNEMRRAVLTGPSPGIKLIDFGSGHYELFDLRFDPNETKNLAGSDPTQLKAAKDAMARIRGTLKEIPPVR